MGERAWKSEKVHVAVHSVAALDLHGLHGALDGDANRLSMVSAACITLGTTCTT